MSSSNTTFMIPENKQLAVAKALQKVFNVDAFENIQQLTKGLSGALVFKITVHGIPYLLRIITRSETRDKPEYYFECLQIAAKAGLAPTIHYLNIEDKISITDYIEDHYFPVPEARIKMADMLRDLHALPKFSYQLNFFNASDMFLQKFLDSDIVPKEATRDLFELYARIGTVYPRNDPDNLVSCHNDVKRDNIIFDGMRPWLVDWEAARLNDRYLDLAAIANFVVKNNIDETDFLKRYFAEKFDEYKRARFFLMSQIVHMFCFTLCAVPGSAGKSIDINMRTLSFNEFHDGLWNCDIKLDNNDELLHYALVHVKELLHNMQTTRFDESLRIFADHNKFQ
jgi:thiamine kinase-like enzyme